MLRYFILKITLFILTPIISQEQHTVSGIPEQQSVNEMEYPDEKQVAAIHPRIFFRAEDINSIREKANTTHSDIWQPILARARYLVEQPVPVYVTGPQSFFQSAGNDVYVTAFAYVITNEPDFLQHTKQRLLEYATWTEWMERYDDGSYVRDFGLQYMIRGVAFAYDWIYNDLSSNERGIVRAALSEHTHKMYEAAIVSERTDWHNWWSESYGQNHWTGNNSALGLAALVLEGDEANATLWLEQAVDAIRLKTEILDSINDGTWHEGMQYQNADLLFMSPFWHNLDFIKSQNYFPAEYLDNFITWRLYNHIPNSTQSVLSFGDYVPYWSGGYGWHARILYALIAGKYKNQHAQWLYQYSDKLFPWGRYSDEAAYWIYEFFYYQPGINSLSPIALPLSNQFDDLNAVIWRTGWEDNELIFGMHVAPYAGKYLSNNYFNNVYPSHNHPDIPGFYIYKGSTDLTSEFADNQDGYEHSRFHNTLLVDAEQQYWNSWGKMKQDVDGKIEVNARTENFNYLIADATNRYKLNNGNLEEPGDRMLDEFRRFVLFIKPGYFVMVDNIRDDSKHQYEWLCHFTESFEVEKNWVKGISSDTNLLGINVMAPEFFAFETEKDTALWNREYYKPYIKIRPAAEVENVRFANILYPTTADKWNYRPGSFKFHEDDQAIGLRLYEDGTKDHLFNYSLVDTVTVGRYIFCGDVAYAHKTVNGNLRSLFLGSGKYIADVRGKRPLFVSNGNEWTVEARFGEGIEMFSEDEIRPFAIYAPSVSFTRVQFNNQLINCTKEGDYIYYPDVFPIDNQLVQSELFYELYPNPVVDNATLELYTPNTGQVNVKISTMTGKTINIISETKEAGYYIMSLDLNDVTPGVYIIEIKVGGRESVKKVLKL